MTSARRVAVAAIVAVGACRAAEGSADRYAALRDRGRVLFAGAGGCTACHSLGAAGGRIVGPNLGVGDGETAPVAARAAARRPGQRPIEYIVESIVAPDAYTVPGYGRGVMPPAGLDDTDVLALGVFLAEPGGPPLDDDALDAARRRIETIRTPTATR